MGLLISSDLTRTADLTSASFKLLRSESPTGNGLPKVDRTSWLTARSRIDTIKRNIQDAREMLGTRLQLLALNERSALV